MTTLEVYQEWLAGALRRQLIEQRFGLLQIARIEPLAEPPVDRSEQFAGLLWLALRAPVNMMLEARP
jgi:hypothetical protein